MELTQLRYFREVAKKGSLTKAARAIFVSQPTLSVAIKNLEEELATTLFLRGHRGVSLTETGRELLEATHRIFEVLEETQSRIRGIEVDDVGRFVIGCPEALGAYFLPPFMKAFLESAPQIEISLWNGPSPAVHQALLRRDVHFGIIVNPIPHPDMTLIPLFEDATDLFVHGEPAESFEAAQDRIEAGPLVYVDGLPQAVALLKALRQAAPLPHRHLACGDLEMVKSLALGGVGVAIIPRRVAAYGAPEGMKSPLVRLHPELPFIPDTIYLTYRSDLHRTRAALRLKDALRGHGKALSSGP